MNLLNAFIEVARYQSFSLAAEALFLTQPAISKRITALEEELGTPLFNRINRSVSLTEAGRLLLPRAQTLRNEMEDMRRFASNLSGDVHGVLTMGTSHHIGLHRLPPILSEFNLRYSAVQLDLRFVESEEACQAVERGELEMAVATLPAELPEQLSAQVIWHDPLYIVAPLDHPLNQAHPASLEQLVQHRCVLPSKDTYTYQVISQALQPLNADLKVYITTNHLETLKMLVSAGFGWSLLPETLLDEKLVIVETALKLQRELGVITHRKRTLSNAARGMLGILSGSL